MHDGKTHSGVDYVWPTKLLRPSHNIQIVYLDLNHWISFARAHKEPSSNGEVAEVLGACISARDSNRAIFPISALTYYELAKIRQEYQRYDLRQVVELLSEYRVVVSPVQVIDREIEAVLDKSYGPNVPGLDPVQYIDRGWVRALGAEDYAADIEAIRAREVDRIASLAPDGVELFEEIFQGFQFFKERAILDGPNWAARRESLVPYVQVADIARIMDARLKQELSLRDAFDLNPSCRRGRIRDYVMTRSVKDDYMPIMAVQLARRGRDGLEFYETRERMRELFDSMPGCDAMVTLKTMYHRNVEHRWAINDIYDIDALSVAMPYCDIVLTDGAVANQANTSQLADRLDVVVSNQLDSLWEILD